MKHEEEPFMSRRAFQDIWLIWLALAVLTTLPYLAAARRAPPGYVFSGVLTAYDDTFSYFAWMRQGADGHVLMCDPFTSEPQPAAFFLPLWCVLGIIARVTHVPIPVIFHAARLGAALLLLIVARGVAVVVMKSRTRVRYTLWLYATSGGLGWLVYLLKSKGQLLDAGAGSGSADLNLPEAIAFRSVFSQVHFAVGAALVIAAVNLFFSALIDRKMNRAAIAGGLTTLLAVVHPYMVVVVCGVGAVSLLASPWLIGRVDTLRESYYWNVRVGAVFGAAAVPGAAYAAYLNRSNEVLREWLRITDTFSPPPWEYALGFGVVAVLAAAGFLLMWNSRAPYLRLITLWAVVQTLLLYAPVSIQRRFVEGLQLSLSIAASVALFWVARRVLTNLSARYHKLFLVGAIAFASLTNVGFIIGQLVARGAGSGATDQRRYVRADLVEAFDWLRANSEPGAVLFSAYITGNIAPSISGLRVFLGHYAQTLYSDEKGAQVTAFYDNSMADEAARRLFAEHRVRYVIYGPFEREIASAFEPPTWLALAHRTGDVEIFEVTDAGGSGSQ